MAFIRNLIEENARLNREFVGSYIISFNKNIENTSGKYPYSYTIKEFFLCKTKGNVSDGIKQLTGTGNGSIFKEITLESKDDGTIYASFDSFYGEVNYSEFDDKKISVRELENLALQFNSKAQKTAEHNCYVQFSAQEAVDYEFIEPVEEEVAEVEEVEQPQEEVVKPKKKKKVKPVKTEETVDPELERLLTAAAQIFKKKLFETEETTNNEETSDAEETNTL